MEKLDMWVNDHHTDYNRRMIIDLTIETLQCFNSNMIMRIVIITKRNLHFNEQ